MQICMQQLIQYTVLLRSNNKINYFNSNDIIKYTYY